MNAKSQNSPRPWGDPDDAPELADDFLVKGERKIGEYPVSAMEGDAVLKNVPALGRQKAEGTMLALTVRHDVDVVEALNATGQSWQTHMNVILRDWLIDYSPG